MKQIILSLFISTFTITSNAGSAKSGDVVYFNKYFCTLGLEITNDIWKTDCQSEGLKLNFINNMTVDLKDSDVLKLDQSQTDFGYVKASDTVILPNPMTQAYESTKVVSLVQATDPANGTVQRWIYTEYGSWVDYFIKEISSPLFPDSGTPIVVQWEERVGEELVLSVKEFVAGLTVDYYLVNDGSSIGMPGLNIPGTAYALDPYYIYWNNVPHYNGVIAGGRILMEDFSVIQVEKIWLKGCDYTQPSDCEGAAFRDVNSGKWLIPSEYEYSALADASSVLQVGVGYAINNDGKIVKATGASSENSITGVADEFNANIPFEVQQERLVHTTILAKDGRIFLAVLCQAKDLSKKVCPGLGAKNKGIYTKELQP